MIIHKLKTQWNARTLRALRKQFAYDPVTGDITRFSTGRVVPKTPAGHGYAQVGCSFEGRLFASTQHALAWFLYYGHMPEKIDHENGEKTDNRITNLRASNGSHNNLNRHKKAGRHQHLPPGVYETKRKGRPGFWYECKVQFGDIIKSTFRRNKDAAIAYVAFHRSQFLKLAAP